MLSRIRTLLLASILLALLAVPSSASAFDVWAFIEINGTPLPGVTVSNPDKAGGIPISSFSYASNRPTGTGGLPTGQHVRSPITMTKGLDGASPLLYRALTNNEPVDEALFKFFRPSASGADELYYEVRITNGVVGSFLQTGGVTDEMEAIKIFFLQMEQTSPIAGTTHTD